MYFVPMNFPLMRFLDRLEEELQRNPLGSHQAVFQEQK